MDEEERKPEQTEKPSRKPMNRREILEYISKTGINIYLIWKPLNDIIDKIDPLKNPKITYDEQVAYIENEIIPWAEEAEEVRKEELAEKTIEEFKAESAARKASVIKKYGNVIDIISEEVASRIADKVTDIVLRRVQSVLGISIPPSCETVKKTAEELIEPKLEYKTYEELYRELDDIRKEMLKEALKELKKEKFKY
jgi:arsenate reductase-like glutaredoxin family protein